MPVIDIHWLEIKIFVKSTFQEYHFWILLKPHTNIQTPSPIELAYPQQSRNIACQLNKTCRRVHIWRCICSSPDNMINPKEEENYDYLTRDYSLVPSHNQQLHSVFLLISKKVYDSLKTSTVMFPLWYSTKIYKTTRNKHLFIINAVVSFLNLAHSYFLRFKRRTNSSWGYAYDDLIA